jgi:hypothetical protein
MNKISKKFVGDFLTDTKGELNWCVFSFDKKTGRRDLAHGGFNFMNAFAVMTEQLAKGFDVILTNKEGWDFSGKFEIEKHRRINYNEMKPYELILDSYSYTLRKKSI